MVDHPAVLVLPVRRVPDLHLLQHRACRRELLDAARIDGCSEFGVFRRVALPLATPVVALVGFFSFVANWTNYFLPYVMLPESDQFPVQVGLGTLLNNVPQFNPTVGTLAVQRPELALATLLAITPVLVVFLFSQRFLVAGMLAGATKELTPARRTAARRTAHPPRPAPTVRASHALARIGGSDLGCIPVITASVPLLEPPGWAMAQRDAVRPARPRLAPVRPRLHRTRRTAALPRPADHPRRRGRLLRGVLQLAAAVPARRRRRPAGRSPSGTGRA